MTRESFDARMVEMQANSLCVSAAIAVAIGDGDQLLVVPHRVAADGRFAGISQTDDDLTCAAAIDVLRWLVAEYEDGRDG